MRGRRLIQGRGRDGGKEGWQRVRPQFMYHYKTLFVILVVHVINRLLFFSNAMGALSQVHKVNIGSM